MHIVEAEICPDYVHMLVEIPPSMSVSAFVGYLKGNPTKPQYIITMKGLGYKLVNPHEK